jgi:hypothetical protein
VRIEVLSSGKCVPSVGGIGIFGAVERSDGVVTWTESGCSGRTGQTILSAKFAGIVIGLRKLRDEHVAHPEAALALFVDDRQTKLQLDGSWMVGANEAHFALWQEARGLYVPLDQYREMYLGWLLRANVAQELVAQTMRRHSLCGERKLR